MKGLGDYFDLRKLIIPTFSNMNHGHGPDALSHYHNLADHSPEVDGATSPFMIIDDKPILHAATNVQDSSALTSASGRPAILVATKEEAKAAQNLFENGNNTPISLSAVGVGLLALVVILAVSIRIESQQTLAIARQEAEDPQDAEDSTLTAPKIAFVFAALALVFLGAEIVTSADGTEGLRQLLRMAQGFNPRAAIDGIAAEVDRLGPLGAAYFAAVYIVAEVLALPAVPLTASAGYLFGAVEGTAIVLFSATIAAGVSFLIGRSLLRSWVERVAGESAQFQAIDRAVASEGFKIILLLRLSPIFPFALSNYFYGLTAVEFGPYLAATLLGFAPGTFLYVYSGEVASVAAGAAGDDAAYPWYVYAGFLSVGAFVAAKVTEVATRALEESGGIVADGDD
jgi:uncharacterized membrane protein YdjX (TVP38/TMEM64 family)